MPSLRGFCLLLIGCLPLASVSAQARADTAVAGQSTEVVPGPQYDTGWLHRLFFGDHSSVA